MPRGKGKVLARAHINLRVSEETLAYFKQHPNYTVLMRSVLDEYVKERNYQKEGAQGNKITAPTTQPTWQEILAEENRDESDSAI